VSEADRQAGVKWAGTVKLGKEGKGPQVRIIEVLGQEETIILATTLDSDEAAPELVAHIYRRRWEVEMFFRWLKCILNCRHFFAESKNGVTLQIYPALIAAVLLSYYTGQKPNRRQMEAIQFYMLGYASAEETARQEVHYAPRAKKS
jgi:hypothetical protein